MLPKALLLRSAKDSDRPTFSSDSIDASKRIICVSLFMSCLRHKCDMRTFFKEQMLFNRMKQK